jgi:tRNA 2-thiouridine synthesizing protein A
MYYDPDQARSHRLKCPLPALKTRKALKALAPGDILEVSCTVTRAVIDIPNLIGKTGDKLEIAGRTEHRIVFMIEKTNRPIEDIDTSSVDRPRQGRDN